MNPYSLQLLHILFRIKSLRKNFVPRVLGSFVRLLKEVRSEVIVDFGSVEVFVEGSDEICLINFQLTNCPLFEMSLFKIKKVLGVSFPFVIPLGL